MAVDMWGNWEPDPVVSPLGAVLNTQTGVYNFPDKPGYVTYTIPSANDGQDNKYEYIQSLINQGAVFADGTPVTISDAMWGKPAYVPNETSNPQAVIPAVDYNPSEPTDYGPLLAGLFLGGATAIGGGLFGGAAAAGGEAAAAGSTLADLYGCRYQYPRY